MLHQWLPTLIKIVSFMAAFLLGLPALLLPLATAVPAWAWIPLACAAAALLVLLFLPGRPAHANVISPAGMLLVSLLAVGASQVFAATPPITDENGRPVPGSIAVLEQVNLNGSEQWIAIRGHDAGKPVLLHLGMGGPGAGGFAVRPLFEPLEKDFVVVYWDEPGTGKSYGAVAASELTPQRFISDAHALTLHLRQRFGQEKIYLYGVSWTSILGVWLVQQYPDLYHAYIGSGQMVNTTENDVLGYHLALDYLEGKGDMNTLEALRRNGPPPYRGAGMSGKYLAFLDILNEVMGTPRLSLVLPLVPFMAQEYGLVDKVNFMRGLAESFEAVYPQLEDLDFMTQAARLDVPVYLFIGRKDVNAMASLAEAYYNALEAPHKRLIWLDGGHGLDSRNMGQFIDVMVNDVLPNTQNQP